VGGEDRAWGDTVWLTQLLNEEGVKIGEPPVRRDNVLQATRTAMKKLGETHRLNFQEISYADKYGRSQPGREAMGAALPLSSHPTGAVSFLLQSHPIVPLSEVCPVDMTAAQPGRFFRFR
jgi:hypothetical protein